MTPITQEIDDLMWRLAESGTDAEKAAFATEHTGFLDELERRTALLARFKNSRQSPVPRTRFVPSSYVPHSNPVPGWMLPAVCLLILGGLAFAGYSTIYRVQANRAQTALDHQPGAAVPDMSQNLTQSQSTPQPQSQLQTQATVSEGATQTGTQVPTAPHTPVGASQMNPAQGDSAGVSKPIVVSRWDTPVTIISKQTDLTSAMLSVASQAHLSLQIAPGLVNPTVEVDYRGQGAKAVLDDMGRVFGFTVMVQTETRALIVPTVDPTAPIPRKVGTVNKATGTSAESKGIEIKKTPRRTGATPLPPLPTTPPVAGG